MFQKITAAEVSKIVGRPEVMYYVVNADSTITHYKWDGTQMVPALSASAVAAVNAAIAQGAFDTPIRLLKSFTGATVLTGGTVNTKTTLMQVAIPDAFLVDYASEIRITAMFGFSLNTNSKSFGVDIGATAGAAVNLWTRTRSSATSAYFDTAYYWSWRWSGYRRHVEPEYVYLLARSCI
jgi:hypothetical protein